MTILGAITAIPATVLIFRHLHRHTKAAEWKLALVPAAITVLMIGWACSVSPFTDWTDTWAFSPVIQLAPIVVTWHISLLVHAYHDKSMSGRRFVLSIVYRAAHGWLFFWLWIASIFMITKEAI